MSAFSGFLQSDFETFHIDGLEPRMEAIRERIQPKFKIIGSELCDELALYTGNEMFLHIAKHARRKVNPPIDTWLAICHNKRGYKQYPHFQVGLFDDRLFVWLALIYELPNKAAMAQNFLHHIDEVKALIPKHFMLSFDHMKKDAVFAGDLDINGLSDAMKRFRDVKKSELLIGLQIKSGDPLLKQGDELLASIKDTFKTLIPLYKMCF